jgi:hypothetical protein
MKQKITMGGESGEVYNVEVNQTEIGAAIGRLLAHPLTVRTRIHQENTRQVRATTMLRIIIMSSFEED